MTVAEVPTIVSLGGGMKDFKIYSPADTIKYQSLMIKYKIYLEDYITKIAEMSK